MPVIVGYGLTETSPVLTIRRLDHNIRGTIGALLRAPWPPWAAAAEAGPCGGRRRQGARHSSF